MSKNRYRNSNNPVNENVVETPEVEVDSVIETEEAVKDPVIETEEVAKEPVENTVNPVYGVVINCERLNIRKQPDKNVNNVLCTVEKNSELTIVDVISDWCKVITSSGVEGYCMKKFVKVVS